MSIPKSAKYCISNSSSIVGLYVDGYMISSTEDNKWEIQIQKLVSSMSSSTSDNLEDDEESEAKSNWSGKITITQNKRRIGEGHCRHKVAHGFISSMRSENTVMIEVCVLCIITLNSDFVEVHTNSPSGMVSREGLEPPFLWFVAIRFLRLSYRDIVATVSSVAPAAFWISSIT